MITVFEGGHVYVVLEFPPKKGDPYVHGVFSDREYAENKAQKLKSRHGVKNYVAVLKKKVKGSQTL